MTDGYRTRLSPAGSRRRDEILAALQREMARRTRRRRGVRIAVDVLALALLAAGASWLALQAPPKPSPGPSPTPQATVVVVRGGGHGLIERIDDEQLLALLVEIARPAGLIRADGRARLTATVTDEARN